MFSFAKFFGAALNGSKGMSFKSLGGRSAFHVYKTGTGYFLLTNNKTGELHMISKDTYRKTYDRYLVLKKFGKEKTASQYSPRNWPACPDAILSPYLAAIS